MMTRLGALLLVLAIVASVDAKQKLPPVTTLPMATRNAGTYGPFTVTVPTGVIGLEIAVDITEATGTLPTMSAALEGSRDGGTNWASAGSFTRPAAPKGNNLAGVLQTTTGATFEGGPFWTDVNNTQRRLRGTATIGGTLRFALRIASLTP